ncbi:Styrene monooxygenase StyA [Paraburkholderia caffeinitolerans]|uniref:Styrene monooxygenase StyA n=1 Tax=Paraburkholderia caffeinitolerans TaxID=1723730 RepID=A0A6J5FXF8_9BURK|nr:MULTISPECIES: styrene monooxygenase/indole monooxygenase family protein [Paraburkholderia]CAB3788705.1 Styrene monooxygenase StyA [Paraburkholderia caffeinitolerans]
MRKITIIGAGQGGLQLGIGLLARDFDVTIVSNRSADQIACGRVMSSQSMYDMAVGYERALGLAMWDSECGPISGVHMRAGGGDGDLMIDWRSPMRAPGQSVDQRIKMPAWMREFERRGGRLLIDEVDVDAIERHAAQSDLVVVSSGKGEIGRLFELDDERSVFDRPQRTISLTYVHGMKPRADYSALNISINPGIGEYVNFPALTISGPCDIINLECIPGGPMDRWDVASTPAKHLELAIELIHTYFPWEAERCAGLRLTDDLGTLVGRITPTVRKPVGRLPSGRAVMGMADVLVLNDPITGQGSNNASKCAMVYLEAIAARDMAAFDEAWMQATFETYWDYAQWVTRFTNAHLLPPPPHLLKIFGACGGNPEVAARVANAFDDPKGLAPWYFDATEADGFLDSFVQTA